MAHKLKAGAIDDLVAPDPGAGVSVEAEVRAILDEVRRDGDAAVRRLTERFDHAELGPDELRVDARELEASLGVLEPAVLEGLRLAVDNVRAVARAQLREPVVVDLPQGQGVEIAEVPVRRVGVYAPGGRAAYPSSVIMCAVTARAAGVEEVAVCAPPGPGGRAHPVVLAACVLCGVVEVYRMGGAQAIGALAYGTESVPAVDVVVGPGNAYVREAKRQVAGEVGIDSPGRAQRARGGGHRRGRPRADRARPPGPGRARRGLGADADLAGCVAARGGGSSTTATPILGCGCWPPRTRARPCGWPTRWRPSTCS